MGIKLVILPVILLFSCFAFGKTNQYSLVLDYMDDQSDCQNVSDLFYFCGSKIQQQRVSSWLEDVQKTAIGRETWLAIQKSGHRLLVMHHKSAILTAGKTLATLTSNLNNGIGTDVVVQMNFDMPDSGTHLVTTSSGDLIPFSARVNFFHELSHARHKMNGTWLMSDSEGQAVRDENIYRQESAALEGFQSVPLRDLFYTENDMQVWFN